MKPPARRNIRYLLATVGEDWTLELARAARVSPTFAEQLKEFLDVVAKHKIPDVEPVVAADWILELALQRWVREAGRGSFEQRSSLLRDVKQMRAGLPPDCVAGQVRVRAGIPRLAEKRQAYDKRVSKTLLVPRAS